MNDSALTGIERTLILEYLLDGKAELFYVSAEENVSCSGQLELEEKKSQISYLKNSQLLLKIFKKQKNQDYGKKIKVSFYFNNLGLYFFTEILENLNGFCIKVPEKIFKIADSLKENSGEFTADIFYSGKNSIRCDFLEDFKLFKKPEIDGIEPQLQIKIKSFIETAIKQLKNNEINTGNGLFLIAAGKYLLKKENEETNSIKDRKNSPALIYLDGQKIVLASRKIDMVLAAEREYEMNFRFNLNGPVKNRIVSAKIKVEDVFEDSERKKLAAIGSFSRIMEEDRRFLSDKFSSSL